MKFDQDLCLNLQYDFGKNNSTLGYVVPLAMFEIYELLGLLASIPRKGCRERMEKVFHLVAIHFQVRTSHVDATS